MSDNTELNSMSGGDLIAADDIGGIKHQRIKLIHGENGTNDGDVSTANGLPVKQATGEIFEVGGDVAHDGADSGNPVKVGYQAVAHGSNPTAVAAADRVNAPANRHGVPFNIGGHPNSIVKEFTVLDSDGAQTNLALISVSSGEKIVVTQIDVVADNANSVDVGVRLGFAAATLTAAALSGVTGIVASHPGIPAGGGISKGDGTGILGIGADGEDLRLTCEDPVSGSIRIVVTYFTIES